MCINSAIPDSPALLQTDKFSPALSLLAYKRKGYKYTFRVVDLVNLNIRTFRATRVLNRKYRLSQRVSLLKDNDWGVISDLDAILEPIR